MTTPPDDFNAAQPVDPDGSDFADALPGLDSFENPGEVINKGRGPGRDNERGDYYAYSTILAKGLRSQSDTLIEFMKTAALKTDEQRICADRLVSWFSFMFNAPVCNRYGMMNFTQGRIDILRDGVEDIREDEERRQALDDIAAAGRLAQEYTAARSVALTLESQGTRGLSREEVEQLKSRREEAQQRMTANDRAAAELSSAARETYSHLLYLRWLEDWVAADEKAGLPVTKYDYTAIKERLAKKEITLLEVLDDLPLPLQKAYQLCQVSLSSGEQWRQMFVLGITNGYGVMPPEEDGAKKKWYQKLAQRPMHNRNPGRGRMAGGSRYD